MGFFRRRRSKPLPPRPRLGGPAEVWLSRAERTVRSLADLTGSLAAGPAAEQLSGVHDGAQGALDQLRGLAGQVTVVESAIARIPSPELADRRDRTAADLAGTEDPQRRADLTRTLADLSDALQSDVRLRATREELLRRMEGATVGLEGLLARASETVVLAGTQIGAGPAEQIADLSEELDGLREGLAETARITGRALRSDPTGEIAPPPA